jgi:hypothetical protein
MSSADGPMVDPDDIEPAGAAIAVAFTGALIAAAGVVLSVVVGRAGFVFAAVGVIVALASPAAHWHVTRKHGR